MGKRFLIGLLPLWVLAAWFLAASPAAAAGDGAARVVSVEWLDAPLPQERLAEVSGLAPGVMLDRAAVARAVRALSEMEEIRQAVVSAREVPGGVAVTVRLVGVQFASAVRVEGASALRPEGVLEASGLRPGHEVGPELLDNVAQRVKQYYFDHGYLSAEVEVAPESGDPTLTRVPVRITVREGDRARVGAVRLPGFPGADADGIRWPSRLRLSTRLGRPLNSKRLEKDIRRIERDLHDAGYLSPRVGPYRLVRQGERVNVIIPVLVDQRVEVTITGSKHLNRREVLEEMDLSGRREVDEPTLTEASVRLRKRLVADGFRDAQVSVTQKADPEDPDLRRVSVVIDEGRRHRIRDIRFEGNYTFTDRQLMELVKPGWRLLEEPAKSRVIAGRAAAIEGALRALGFPGAKVGFRFDGHPRHPHVITVTYEITEGPRWWFDSAVVTGVEGMPEPGVAAAAATKARELDGLPFRRDRLRAARGDVRQVIAEAGYPDARVAIAQAERDVWRGKITPRGVPLREVMVDTEFQVDTGPAVTIGKVVIDGTFRTRRYVIERELTFHEGGAYTLSSLAESRRRLFRTAAFDQVRIGQLDPDDRDGVRDVRVHLMEGRPGAVELGLGYGEGDGIRGLIDISYRDMFRRGHRANARYRYGQLRKTLSFGYLLPWIAGRRVNLRTRLLFEHEDLTAYERIARAVEAGVRRELSDTVTATVTYRLERNRFPRQPVTKLPERYRINVGSILFSLVRDARDSPFTPTRGNLLGVTYEQGAHILLSEVQFGKGTAQAAGYLPLGRSLVVAARMQGGRVRQLFDSTEVPVSERFFMGGHSTVRGYKLDSIGVPNDTLDPLTGSATGGNVMALGNLELRWGSDRGWGSTLFADAGNVWDRGSTVGVNDFRVGVGIGINYATPVGPLRLDWGYKVDRQPGEEAYRFHFTLGHTF